MKSSPPIPTVLFPDPKSLARSRSKQITVSEGVSDRKKRGLDALRAIDIHTPRMRKHYTKEVTIKDEKISNKNLPLSPRRKVVKIADVSDDPTTSRSLRVRKISAPLSTGSQTPQPTPSRMENITAITPDISIPKEIETKGPAAIVPEPVPVKKKPKTKSVVIGLAERENTLQEIQKELRVVSELGKQREKNLERVKSLEKRFQRELNELKQLKAAKKNEETDRLNKPRRVVRKHLTVKEQVKEPKVEATLPEKREKGVEKEANIVSKLDNPTNPIIPIKEMKCPTTNPNENSSVADTKDVAQKDSAKRENTPGGTKSVPKIENENSSVADTKELLPKDSSKRENTANIAPQSNQTPEIIPVDLKAVADETKETKKSDTQSGLEPELKLNNSGIKTENPPEKTLVSVSVTNLESQSTETATKREESNLVDNSISKIDENEVLVIESKKPLINRTIHSIFKLDKVGQEIFTEFTKPVYVFSGQRKEDILENDSNVLEKPISSTQTTETIKILTKTDPDPKISEPTASEKIQSLLQQAETLGKSERIHNIAALTAERSSYRMMRLLRKDTNSTKRHPLVPKKDPMSFHNTVYSRLNLNIPPGNYSQPQSTTDLIESYLNSEHQQKPITANAGAANNQNFTKNGSNLTTHVTDRQTDISIMEDNSYFEEIIMDYESLNNDVNLDVAKKSVLDTSPIMPNKVPSSDQANDRDLKKMGNITAPIEVDISSSVSDDVSDYVCQIDSPKPKEVPIKEPVTKVPESIVETIGRERETVTDPVRVTTEPVSQKVPTENGIENENEKRVHASAPQKPNISSHVGSTKIFPNIPSEPKPEARSTNTKLSENELLKKYFYEPRRSPQDLAFVMDQVHDHLDLLFDSELEVSEMEKSRQEARLLQEIAINRQQMKIATDGIDNILRKCQQERFDRITVTTSTMAHSIPQPTFRKPKSRPSYQDNTLDKVLNEQISRDNTFSPAFIVEERHYDKTRSDIQAFELENIEQEYILQKLERESRKHTVEEQHIYPSFDFSRIKESRSAIPEENNSFEPKSIPPVAEPKTSSANRNSAVDADIQPEQFDRKIKLGDDFGFEVLSQSEKIEEENMKLEYSIQKLERESKNLLDHALVQESLHMMQKFSGPFKLDAEFVRAFASETKEAQLQSPLSPEPTPNKHLLSSNAVQDANVVPERVALDSISPSQIVELENLRLDSEIQKIERQARNYAVPPVEKSIVTEFIPKAVHSQEIQCDIVLSHGDPIRDLDNRLQPSSDAKPPPSKRSEYKDVGVQMDNNEIVLKDDLISATNLKIESLPPLPTKEEVVSEKIANESHEEIKATVMIEKTTVEVSVKHSISTESMTPPSIQERNTITKTEDSTILELNTTHTLKDVEENTSKPADVVVDVKKESDTTLIASRLDKGYSATLMEKPVLPAVADVKEESKITPEIKPILIDDSIKAEKVDLTNSSDPILAQNTVAEIPETKLEVPVQKETSTEQLKAENTVAVVSKGSVQTEKEGIPGPTTTTTEGKAVTPAVADETKTATNAAPVNQPGLEVKEDPKRTADEPKSESTLAKSVVNTTTSAAASASTTGNNNSPAPASQSTAVKPKQIIPPQPRTFTEEIQIAVTKVLEKFEKTLDSPLEGFRNPPILNTDFLDDISVSMPQSAKEFAIELVNEYLYEKFAPFEKYKLYKQNMLLKPGIPPAPITRAKLINDCKRRIKELTTPLGEVDDPLINVVRETVKSQGQVICSMQVDEIEVKNQIIQSIWDDLLENTVKAYSNAYFK